MEKMKKVVPDTSAIVNGSLRKLVEDGHIDGGEIMIPQIVMGELQGQASRMKESGFSGLSEITKIRELSKKHKLKLNFVGERPKYEDILLAKSGRIDALIQDIAKENDAVLVTSDMPQSKVAEAQGLEVKYFEAYKKAERLKIERFFTKDTMSIHLKEKVKPYAKRGKPGHVELVELEKERLKREDLEKMINEIMDAARYEEDAFIEISEHDASVVQLRKMRISIARPPFSDGLEITAIRPTIKLTLDDYKLSEKLKQRLVEKAEGILVSGPPGSGKSTFSASLAEFYMNQGKIVKTMESPRDLDVLDEITQYAPLDGSFAKTADILLLVRPDYTIFDEVRKTKDFEIFADMRLAGVGMVGVVHSSAPVDAIQRFIGRIELGVIPHVLDTIIFIKSGQIEKVYNLSLLVKVPTGMTEEDLARPLVEVRDFETNKIEYEIYTYGDQTVVVPVTEQKKPALHKLAAEKILEEVRHFDRDAEVEFVSDNKVVVKLDNDKIAKIIGKEGKTIKALEGKLGISIDVQPLVESMGKEAKFEIGETGAYLVLSFKNLSGKNANVYVESEYLFTATVGRNDQIKITKSSDIGKELLRAITSKRAIKVFI